MTLVELLVTLSIAALSAVLIMGTVRPADPLRAEGEALARTIFQLDAGARISGKPAGLRADEAGYTVLSWENGGWVETRGGKHALRRGVALVLPARDGNKDTALVAPSLVFDPLGHSSLPELTLVSGREQRTVIPADVLAGKAVP